MTQSAMTAKERVRAAIRHQETDRLPIDFIARDEIVEKLFNHFGTRDGETLLEALNVDLRGVGPTIKFCASTLCYADPTVRMGTDPDTGQSVYYDLWGVGFVQKEALGGMYFDLCESPLKNKGTLDDLRTYPFPQAGMWDYSTIGEQIRRHRDRCIWAHSRGFFEISWFMRGMDNFMMDLMINREYAECLMDRIIEYLIERTMRILAEDREGLIDFVELNDDVGGQNGLLMSPDLWREVVKPRMKRMITTFKEKGVSIRYHCCGGVRDIIPDLIEIGVDILNPVQPLAHGMGLAGLKRDFGARITFDGGIDTQELLPGVHGPQFEEEVRRILGMMGQGGGYIMAPAHALQVDVPLENILNLYRWAAEPHH